jgi:ankyrin repeat protein
MELRTAHGTHKERAVRSGIRRNLAGAFGLALLLSAATSATLPPDVANAAMRGDREAVRALLQQGADVNMAQGDGMTALHWAAERGDAAMTEMLLYAGASVRATTRIGEYTPLHLAAKSGSAPIIDLLIKGGADVKATTTNSGATALHFAAASGGGDAVTALLRAGADANAKEGLWQQTPLMFAASLNRGQAITALIAGGADPNIRSYVRTAVDNGRDQAATAKQREMMEAFRAGGQTPTPSQIQAAIEAGRAAARTANQEAAAEVQQIANRDPDEPPIQAGSTTDPGGLSPLLHAARQGHVDAARALLDGGADVNLVSGTDGTSPLLMATINSQWDVAMLLIERGADPNRASTLTNAAPLWSTINAQYQPRTRFPQPQEGWYQQASYLDVMEALLKAGADPDVKVSRQPYYLNFSGCGNGNCGLTQLGGTNAFLRAAHGADAEAMRLLAIYGADVKAGRTPAPQGGGGGGGGGRGGAAQGGRGGGQGGQGGAQAGRGGAQAGQGGAQAGRGGGQQQQGGRGGAAQAAAQQGGRGGGGDTPAAAGQQQQAGGGGGGAGGFGAPGAGRQPTAPASAIHMAAGLGFGQGVGAGNANRFKPEGWMSAMRYLVEELGFDVNARDDGGFTPLHFAAARGDNEMIRYLVSKGGDIKARSNPANGFPDGFTVADMANGPQPRITPMPATIALAIELGSEFTDNCRSCE